MAHTLDTVALKNKDALRMLKFIESLPAQLEEGIKIASRIKPPEFQPGHIIIGGMGGSAISGDILLSLLFRRAQMPIHVNRSPYLPTFVSKETLAFIMSYSGNTIETIKMFEEAIIKGAYVVALSSGGELKKLAKKHGTDFIGLPQGLVPRAAIGYMLTPVLIMLKMMKIYDPDVEISDAIHVVRRLHGKIAVDVPYKENEAKQLAHKMRNSVPIVYGHTFYSAVARRWHTQLNENAKMLSWWGTIPEIGHNEIEGWAGDKHRKNFFVILLRDREEKPEIKTNVEAVKDMMTNSGIKLHEVWCEGSTYLGKIMYGIYYGDVLSVYLAVMRGKSASAVPTINNLKAKITANIGREAQS